jgi:hypothetical protein
MPPWMEILLNLIGYGGFIAVAQFHKRPGEHAGAEDNTSLN